MGIFGTIGQKLKGKGQQMKGEIEIKSGHHVEGTIDKIKGKANEMGADIKMKVEDSKS